MTRMTKRMKSSTKTKTETTSLESALRHGSAHHERGPWRIVRGLCQEGVPQLDKHGEPLKKSGTLLLLWRKISRATARDRWKVWGWVLE